VRVHFRLPAGSLRGVRGPGLKLISEYGCQPTSRPFLRVAEVLKVARTLPATPTPGNAETGRFRRTRQTASLWRTDCADLEDTPAKVAAPGQTGTSAATGMQFLVTRAPGDMARLMRTSRTRPEAKLIEPQKCLDFKGVLPIVSHLFPGRT